MASLDGQATGASVEGEGQSETEKPDVVNGNKQETATADPTALNGIYDAPEGVELSDIDTEGSDLVITLPSGETLRVEGAADQFTQIEINEVLFEIPWTVETVAAGQQSSGGNFVVDPGEMPPGIPIVPLLPPTELAFGFPEVEEIFLLEETGPEIVGAEDTLVDEDGFQFANVDEVPPLPTETDGDENLMDSGIITINFIGGAPNNPGDFLILNDLDSYDGQLTSNGQPVIFSKEGDDLVGRLPGEGQGLEVIRISIASVTDQGGGLVDYEYKVTLSQPVDHPNNSNEDTITLAGIQFTVFDTSENSITGTFDVGILDDVPQAFDDCFVQVGFQDEYYDGELQQAISPGDFGNGENQPVSGNVLDDNGFGADIFGADGPGSPVAFFVDESLTGAGNLTFNSDGSFTYIPAPGEEGDVTFQYFIVDNDGDRSTATVTLKLQDDSVPEINVEQGGTSVDEDGLIDANPDNGLPTEANHGGAVMNAGQIVVDFGNDIPADLNAAIVFDDLASYDTQLTSGGEPVTFALVGGDLVGSTASLGEVIRISIEPGPIPNGFGSFTYTYKVTLSEEVDQPGNDNEDSVVLSGIQFTVTDGDDGDPTPGTLDVTIYDDVPEALDDNAGQGDENDPITVDVFANDVAGADGVDTADPAKVFASNLSGAGTLVYNNDGTFTYTPAPGEESPVSFDYTIVDGDGDRSTATVTIELRGDSRPTIQSEEGQVDEAALSDGSNPGSTAEMTSGTFTFDTGNDGLKSLVIDGVDVTNGGTVTGDYGTLVVTETSGTYSWKYTLDDNTTDHPNTTSTGTSEGVQDIFDIVLTDNDDMDTATATLAIDVLDDGPAAEDDFFIQNPENADVTGNVLNDNGAGPDVQGADNPGTVALVPLSLSGTGTLTLNPDGTFTYEPSPGEEGTVTFDYTLTDTDGDVSTATVTITLQEDSVPTIGDERGEVDEAALPDGSNPGSNAEMTTGTFTIDVGNDGLGCFLIEDKDGVLVDVTNGGTVQGDYGTLVVTENNGAYTWKYTLDDNSTDHPDNPGSGTAEGVQDIFNITIKDADDGDTATATLTIDVLDDGPDAIDDFFTQNPENTDVTGNVLDNNGVAPDVEGADNPGTVTLVPNTLSGTGTLTLNPDGTFTYEPGPGEEGVVTFDYTLTDTDGDTDTATVTITLARDSVPVIDAGDTSVDEDGLADANADGGLPTESDHGGAAMNTGQITVDFGNDIPADLDAAIALDDLAAYDTQLTSGGEPVTFALVGGDLVGSTASLGEVICISINPGPADNGSGSFTYTYKVTLSQEVDHPGNNNEDSIVLSGIQFTVTDGDDGDPTSGTIDVTVYDDVPEAVADVATTPEDTPITVDVLANDVIGADQPGVLTGATIADTATGSISFNTATGEITFTPAAGFEGDATITYTIEDADGDEATGTLTITVEDDSDPTFEAASATVDEDGFPFANDDAPTGLEVGSTGSLTDTQVITIDYGNDTPVDLAAAFTLNDLGSYDGQLKTLAGDNVVFALESGALVGRSAGDNSEVIRIEITNITDNGGGLVDYEYTVTLSQPVQHPANDNEDTVTLAGISFTATDNDNDPVTGTFDVSVVDDVPTAVADTATTPEDTPITVDVLANDIIGADQPGVLTGATIADTATGTVSFNTATGEITFTPASGFEGDATITYTIEDADGDEATGTLTVTVEDDSDPTFEIANAVVDEDGFPFANVDTPTVLETDSTESLTNVQVITVNYSNDTPADLGAAFSLVDTAGLDTQLDTLDGHDVVFSLESGVLVGRSAGDNSEVIRIEITNVTDNGGGLVDYEYTVTLSQPVQHPLNDQEDTVTLSGVTFTATDNDGDTSTGTFSVDIVDDVPIAADDDATTEVVPTDLNVAFVIDFSGSIDDAELTEQMDAIKAAGQELFANANGANVTIHLVGFAIAAIDLGAFTSEAAFAAAVDALNPGEGGDRPDTDVIGFRTNFTAAIEETMDVWAPVSGAENLVFFLSDGNPNEELGTGGNSLADATAIDWATFISDSGLDVTPIGVGNNIDTDRLLDVDLDSDPNAILVADFGGLINTLLELVQPEISGNLLANDSFGADGPGQILSVTIDGVTYTWDSAADDPQISPPPGDGSVSGSELTVKVSLSGSTINGIFTLDFATGDWTFQGPVAADPELVTYIIEDADGDESMATLMLDMVPNPAPVVSANNAEVDEDGFAFANVDTPTGLETDSTESLTDTQTINVDYNGDVPADIDAAFVLKDSPALDGQLKTNDGDDVVFSLESGVLVGRSAGDNSEVIRIEITSSTVKLDGTVDYEYTVTLSQPVQHPTNDTEDFVTLSDIGFTATDSDGQGTMGTFDVKIVDDVPIAKDGDGTTTVVPSDINVAFVIDFSGSISDSELTEQMDAIKAAGLELFANASGAVTIHMVGFAIAAIDLGEFTSEAAFIAAVDALNPGEGGARPDTDVIGFRTNFTAAIEETMDAWVPDPSAENLVFFLSDGNPNEELGTGGNSLADLTAVDWASFISTNDLTVNSIGVGNNIDTDRLLDVDLDGDPNAILVADFDGLVDTLLELVQPKASGNVLTDGAMPDSFGADGPGQIVSLTVDGVTYTWNGGGDDPQIVPPPGEGSISGSELTVKVSLDGSLIKGILTFDFATGDWMFQAPTAADPELVTYVIEDADGDNSSATLILDLNEEPAPTAIAVDDAVVDEDGFAFANLDTPTALETDSTESLMDTGVITIDYLGDFPADIDAAFALKDSPALDGQLKTNDGDDVVFSLESGDLVGRSAGDNSEVIRIEITGSTDNLDGTVDYEYKVTLSQPVKHPSNDTEDIVTLTGVSFTATDSNGHEGGGHFDVDIVDDVPVATDNDGTQAAPPVDSNVVFIIDFSGSISDEELTEQMDAIKAAGQELFANASGAVTIHLVGFAIAAVDLGAVTTEAAFIAAVDALNPGENGERPNTNDIGFRTNFTAAIEETMDKWVPDPSAENLVFFLSDGNPNEELGTGGNSLADATAISWASFISTHDLTVNSIGVGDSIDTDRLLDVDLDSNPEAILVDDFGSLIGTLLSLVQPEIDGNVLTDGVADSYGADGPGRIVALTVDGVTYTWDGGVGDPQIVPAPAEGSTAGSVLTVNVALSGTTSKGILTFDFATGDWTFQGPAAADPELVTYTIADADGDESSATLTLDITGPAAPPAPGPDVHPPDDNGDDNGADDGSGDDSGDDNGADDGSGDDSGDDNGADDGSGDDSGDDNGADDGSGDDSGDDNGADDGSGDDSGDDNGADDGSGDDNGDDNGADDGSGDDSGDDNGADDGSGDDSGDDNGADDGSGDDSGDDNGADTGSGDDDDGGHPGYGGGSGDDDDGYGGHGPDDFIGDIIGDETGTELSLLSGFMDQFAAGRSLNVEIPTGISRFGEPLGASFKDTAPVFENPEVSRDPELGPLDTLGASFKDTAPVLENPQVSHGLDLSSIEGGLAGDLGLSATVDLDLADMLDQASFDLSGLVGEGPEAGPLNTLPAGPVESVSSGLVPALQIEDQISYDHA